GDQGVAPKSVEIMSNKDVIFKSDTWRIGEDLYQNSALHSVSFKSEQSAKKTKKKGRVIGTLVGVGIGGGLGYLVYRSVPIVSGEWYDTIELIIIPTVVGGLVGYIIGTYYDVK
ncbi:MAG: hypothetical protein QME07_06075, partial [bacterium]|nr:hypothetical protein [bacterium]